MTFNFFALLVHLILGVIVILSLSNLVGRQLDFVEMILASTSVSLLVSNYMPIIDIKK